MTSVATAPRRKGQILLRRLRYLASEVPRRLLRYRVPSDVSTIGIVGSNDRDVIADAATRLAWAAPEAIRIVSSDMELAARPGWAGTDVPDMAGRLHEGDPLESDLLVIADAAKARWIRRMSDHRSIIGDPNWYSGVEVESFAAISRSTITPDEWREIRSRSQEALAQLQKRFQSADSVCVFGTGPSMTSIDPSSLNADVTIACNSAVSNETWISAAKPSVVVLGDPVFHFGPSRYAAQFRADLLRTARQTEAVFVIPQRFAPLVMRRLPELAGRLIAVEHANGVSLDGLSVDHLVVPQTDNVLTLLMLPVALALGNNVAIAGCDGRRPSERYFWSHSSAAQYGEDLMSSAFAAHPSFFRDRDYQKYYDNHCIELEEMLSRAEDDGRRFVSVTPSEIPALRRRTMP